MLKFLIPDFYSKLLPEEFLNLPVRETKATCDNCNWSKYKKDLKCCTFEPYLPNYLVGAILLSDLPGKQAVINKIKKRNYAMPIGLVAPVSFQVEFNKKKDQFFGQKSDWLCPYYNRQSKNCGIWRYRGVVCTTYYCQSSYGKKGLRFWDEFSNYLSLVEMTLMEEVLVHMDFSPQQISEQIQYLNRKTGSPSELRTQKLSPAKLRLLWLDRLDQQEDFFIECFKFVQKMDAKDLKAAMGQLGENLQAQLRLVARDSKIL